MFPNYREFHLSHFFFQSNAGSGAGSGAGDNSNVNNSNNNSNSDTNTNKEPENFDAWLAAQPDEVKNKVKSLYDASIVDLKNTVKATRTERDDFSKQLRDASKKLEAGSDQQKQLLELANSNDEANRRADFYEQAPQYECKNPKAAYAIAKSQDLFTKSGAPDWKSISAEAPELFGKVIKTIKGSAGSGTGKQVTNTGSMNDWIRKEAGVAPSSSE